MSAEGDAFRERMRSLRALFLDVDGVLTDGTVWLGPSGDEHKRFHVHDGVGIQRAREAGLAVGWISGRRCASVERRARELGVEHLRQGVPSKEEGFDALCRDLDLAPRQVAYMGDDVTDLGALRRAGVALAPAGAADEVRAAAHHVTVRPGGAGAVRDAVAWILRHRGPA